MPTEDEIYRALVGPGIAGIGPINVTGAAPYSLTWALDDDGFAFPGLKADRIVSWAPWPEEQATHIRAALAGIEGLANVRFRQVARSDEADLVFGNVGEFVERIAGLGGFAVDYTERNGVYDHAWRGFVTVAEGSDAATHYHELGHALGLKHPFEGKDRLPASVDHLGLTLMSYSHDPAEAEREAAVTAFGLYDAIALQGLWGAAGGVAGEDTVYALPGGAAAADLPGAATAALQGVLHDTGGYDVIDLRLAAEDGRPRFDLIDLNPGTASSGWLGDALLRFAIAPGTVIEAVYGPLGHDATILGNDAGNLIAGQGVLVGGAGDDTLRSDLPGHGAASLQGGAGDDVLTGGAGDDRLEGGAGADRLEGGRGDDVLTGGANAAPGSGASTRSLGDFGASRAAGGWSDAHRFPRALADVDGDGRLDIVGFGGAGVLVARGTIGGGFADPVRAIDDFARGQGWKDALSFPRRLADVDGDGRADILGLGAARGYVAYGQADGRFAGFSAIEAGFTAATGWAGDARYPRHAADVNGDGLADLVGFGGSSTFTALGRGDGTFGEVTRALGDFSQAQGWQTDERFPRILGDVNGDGRADIVGFGASRTFTALGQSDGGFGPLRVAIADFAGAQGWNGADALPRLLGDVNGDGRTDIVGFGARTTFAALARADGTFGEIAPLSKEFHAAAGWASQAETPRALGDLDGDGRADLLGFAADGVRSAVTGTGGDKFVFSPGWGADRITDLEPGDRIAFTGDPGLGGFEALLGHARQEGDDTVIALRDDRLTLEDVALADLSAADFLFS